MEKKQNNWDLIFTKLRRIKLKLQVNSEMCIPITNLIGVQLPIRGIVIVTFIQNRKEKIDFRTNRPDICVYLEKMIETYPFHMIGDRF